MISFDFNNDAFEHSQMVQHMNYEGGERTRWWKTISATG
jgi:hypothetical protein